MSESTLGSPPSLPPAPRGSQVLGLGVRSPQLGLSHRVTLGKSLALSEPQCASSGTWCFGKADAPWPCRGGGGEGGEARLRVREVMGLPPGPGSALPSRGSRGVGRMGPERQAGPGDREPGCTWVNRGQSEARSCCNSCGRGSGLAWGRPCSGLITSCLSAQDHLLPAACPSLAEQFP